MCRLEKANSKIVTYTPSLLTLNFKHRFKLALHNAVTILLTFDGNKGGQLIFIYFRESVTRAFGKRYTTLINESLIWVSMVSMLLVHLSEGHRTVFFRGPSSEAVLIKALRKYEVGF